MLALSHVRGSLRGLAVSLLALSGCHPDQPAPVPPEFVKPTVRASPSGGAFLPPLQVSLTCESQGRPCAEIRYTLDGSAPTATSARYDGPFWLQASATLRFTGWDTGGQSASGEARYQADSEVPLASATPAGGLFAADQLVELHCSDGAGAGCALIRYTLDGSAVGPGSPVYGLPMVVTSDTRVRFVAVDLVGNQSVEGDQQYRFDRTGPISAAVPAGGAFRLPVGVTLGCADVGPAGCATIHYTVDGSAPTPYSPVAEAPLTVAATTVVRFLSVDTLGNVGTDVTERYVVDGTPPVTTASPAPGLYADGLIVRFACEDLGVGCATTRYTLDGSEPGPGSPEVVPGRELTLSTSATLRFASEDLLGNLEAFRSARFEIDARAPVTTASPAGGTFAGPIDLVLACDDGTGADASGCDSIHYTTDGSAPGPGSPMYTGPIHLMASATVAFYGVDAVSHRETPHAVAVVIDQAPPRVTATTPLAGQAGLAVEAVAKVTFDEPVDLGTLAMSATAGGAGVAGATTYDPASRTATFTPAAPLPPDADVTITLAAGLADALGNATAAAQTFTFHTRGLPVILPAAGAATLRVAGLGANAAGDVVVVFTAYTGTATSLRYATRLAGGGWSDSAELSATGGSGVSVTSDGTGFLLAWISSNSLVARTLSAGQLGPLEVVAAAQAVSRVAVASNGSGYAVAWSTTQSGYLGGTWNSYPCVSVRIREGSAWQPPVTFGAVTNWTEGPALASAGGGYVLAFRSASVAQWRAATFNELRVFTAQGGGAWTGNSAFIDAQAPVSAPALASDGARYGLLFATARDVQFGLASVPAPGVNASFALAPLEARTGVTRVALSAGAAGFGAAWQSVEGSVAVTRGAARADTGWGAAAEAWGATGTPARLVLTGGAMGHLAVAQVKDPAGVVATRLLPLGPTGFGPAEAPADTAAGLLATAAGAGFRLAWDEDDGAVARLLRSRVHDGTTAGPAEDVLAAPLPSSAAGLRIAVNDVGDIMAVWLGQHRGSQALFASLRQGGAFGAPTLVAFPASAPAVASDGTGFAVGYVETGPYGVGDAVVRRHGGSGFGPPEKLTSNGSVFSIVLASDGSTYAAVYDQGSVGGIQVRVETGGSWEPSFALTTQGSISSDESIIAWPGAYEIGLVDFTPGALAGRLRSGAAGWAASTVRLAPTAWLSAWNGPGLARGESGLLLTWFQDGHPTFALDAGAGYGPAQQLDARYCSSLGRLLAAPLGTGFVAVGSCGPVRAWVFDGAWRSLVSEPPASDSTLFALRSSAAGPALLYEDRSYSGGAASLRVSHFLGGAFTPPVHLASGAGSAQLIVSGPAVAAGWTEADPADATRTRAAFQGGL